MRQVLTTVALLAALSLAACGGRATSSDSLAPPAAAASDRTPSPSASSLPVMSPTVAPIGLAPTGATEEARVVRVIDGDTIVVDRGRGDERVRYIGIDTPETVRPGVSVEWMGKTSSAANKALVEGKTVVLEKDVSETDRFDRLLRHVWLQDGSTWVLVDLELVRIGYARVSTYPPDVKYSELYLAAQVEAREQDLGLWGDGPLTFVSPEDGSVIATKTIVVHGLSIPGSRVVRDVSGGLDQSARAATDGSWSMEIKLKSGINTLRFRIEDEKETTRSLQVVYSP